MPYPIRQVKTLPEAIALYAPATAPVAPFDWQPLIARQRPGQETVYQQQQSVRFALLRQALAEWAARFALPAAHVDRAAYFTIVSTEQTLPDVQVLALAQTIFWIYVCDDFLDQRLLTRQLSTSEAEEAPTSVTLLAQVDCDLSIVVKPLTIGLDSISRRQQTDAARLLGELFGAVQVASLATARQHDITPQDLSFHLGEALYALLAHLDQLWQSLATRQDDRQFRRMVVCKQFARCIASMRREFRWNLQLASNDPLSVAQLPLFMPYLVNGAVSIGMYAVATVVATFERKAESSWQHGLAAIDLGGRIVRLTNDIQTYPREAEEGKLSAITLLLGELGYALRGHDPLQSAEVSQATQVVSHCLRHTQSSFAAIGDRMQQNSPLAYFLRHAVASALSVYGDGS